MTTKQNFREYLQGVLGIYYPQGDTRKMRADIFTKEVSSAMDYGAVCALQNILRDCGDYSKDEILGELQVRLIEHYSTIKNKLKMKTPSLRVEDILKNAEVES